MIRIRRKSQYVPTGCAAYHVVWNGQDVGVIRRGETRDFDVSPGPHKNSS